MTANDDWVELKGHIRPADIRALRQLGHIQKLSIVKAPLLTARVAQAFSSLVSVSQLWLWCDATRTAMRSVIAISGLKVLDVLSMTPPGKLEGFASATSLEIFRGNHYLTEADLLDVTTCRSLREIGAQSAALSPRVIEALLALPRLESLNLEATVFDDDMAERISTSKQLLSLDVGATKLTRQGLIHLCQMRQLRSLDLWATRIEEDDVELLSQLRSLEYLSIGGIAGSDKFNAHTLLPRLSRIGPLQRVWLDGVRVSRQQKKQLESRFSTVRIT